MSHAQYATRGNDGVSSQPSVGAMALRRFSNNVQHHFSTLSMFGCGGVRLDLPCVKIKDRNRREKQINTSAGFRD